MANYVTLPVVCAIHSSTMVPSPTTPNEYQCDSCANDHLYIEDLKREREALEDKIRMALKVLE